MKGQTGALVRFGRRRQRHAPILSSLGSTSLYHSAVAVSPASRFFFSIFSDSITLLRSAVIVGPLSAVSVKNGRMLMRFFEAASHRIVLTLELDARREYPCSRT